MMHIDRTRTTSFLTILTLAFFILFSSGCAMLQGSEDETAYEPAPENAPYYPSGMVDIQIPGELSENREDSLYIDTASFIGGIKSFSGRVEINSLSDFFVTTMEKNGWKKVGNIQYKNVLLAFSKPNKTCMISIFDAAYGMKTKVYIYVTQDIESSTFQEGSLQ